MEDEAVAKRVEGKEVERERDVGRRWWQNQVARKGRGEGGEGTAAVVFLFLSMRSV